MRYFSFIILVLAQICLCAQAKPLHKELLESFPNIRDYTISILGNEAYLSAQSPLGEVSVILRIVKENNEWKEPTVADFSGKYHDLEPFLSTDGLTLYFASNRPMDQISKEVKDYDIWYTQRTSRDSDWQKPINFGSPINTSGNEFYPSLANNGNLYFTSDGEGTKGLDDIFFSEYKEGEYLTPVSLDTAINSAGYEFNAFVAPDESYLLFTGYDRLDGYGSGDLYLSRKNMKGSWARAENMGEKINSNQMDYCPFVDPTTKQLYYTSRRSGIEPLDEPLLDLQVLKELFNTYENGHSRLYTISVKKLLARGTSSN